MSTREVTSQHTNLLADEQAQALPKAILYLLSISTLGQRYLNSDISHSSVTLLTFSLKPIIKCDSELRLYHIYFKTRNFCGMKTSQFRV